MRFFISKISTISCLLTVLLTLFHCSDSPVKQKKDSGSVELRIQIVSSLNKVSASYKTDFDSLIVNVAAPDLGDTISKHKKIDVNQIFIIDTIDSVPSGSNRKVTIFTKNKNGDTIHIDSAGTRTIKVDPNLITSLNCRLLPRYGSLYIQLVNLSTNIDTVYAQFISKNGTEWQCKAPRMSKTVLSLDYIPHLTEGNLIITGKDKGGVVLANASKKILFNAYQMNTINMTFQSNPGKIAVSGDLKIPGVTLVQANVIEADSIYETGTLLITEIMYNANDSEYIEIYNPAETPMQFDTLICQIDQDTVSLANVLIAAKKYIVIGRASCPWVDSVSSDIDLTSAHGNWITLSTINSTVLDRVAFSVDNKLDWPKISDKRSIELDTLAYDVNKNNFGCNWHSATSLLDSTVAKQYGSPHHR